MGSHTSKKHKTTKVRIPKYDLNHFGVITVVFNPLKYRSREELYHKFDEHMTRSGVTLLTVECIFEASEDLGLPKQEFKITRSNDPRHLQIKAPSILWLKENLINMAIKRLPPYVEYVAWLDADIEFERLDWPHLAINQLQHYPIIQLFESASFLGAGGKKQVLRRDHSFAYAIRHGLRIDPRRSSECFVHPGYGWAMRRNTFNEMGGLLDFSILGSGDIHFCYALINRIEETIPPGIHEDYRYLARIWGQRVAQIANNGTSVGYVPIHIYHYYHGNRVNRGYFERWNILENFQFSPSKDLEKNNQTGLLRLTDYRRSGQRHLAQRLDDFEKTIISYFGSRNEDNLKRPIPAINRPLSNTRSKFSSNDTVRPIETLSGHYQVYDDHQYIHLQDVQSGHRLNERNSFGFDSVNEAYYPTFARGSKYQQYPIQNYFGQMIYYDDGNGNNYAASPGEISF